jgi:hypothetical protein
MLLSKHVERDKTNVVLCVGTTSGTLAKSMPECFTKNVVFIGVLKHGNADRVDNVILPEGVMYTQKEMLEAVLVHIGKPADKVRVLALFYEALDDDIVNVENEYKLGTNAKMRMAAVTAFIGSMPGDMPVFVRAEDPVAADLAAVWSSQIYWPANFSLAHPFFLLCASSGYVGGRGKWWQARFYADGRSAD